MGRDQSYIIVACPSTVYCKKGPDQTSIRPIHNSERQVEKMIRKTKTYSSRDSHVVTHRSTNLPFNCLCMAERTGCPVFS
ncbi:hypothetical protein KCU77_g16686, partial [Aureobasidium melanogenum]